MTEHEESPEASRRSGLWLVGLLLVLFVGLYLMWAFAQGSDLSYTTPGGVPNVTQAP